MIHSTTTAATLMNYLFIVTIVIHVTVPSFGVRAQLMQARLATVPYYSSSLVAAEQQQPQQQQQPHPPLCTKEFLEEFSSGIWDWIHGLIEFILRDHDFRLDNFTMSDAPYQRYLEQQQQDNQRKTTATRSTDMNVAKATNQRTNGNMRGRLSEQQQEVVPTITPECKTCQHVGCNVWCSPRFCKRCDEIVDDDDIIPGNRRRLSLSSAVDQETLSSRRFRRMHHLLLRRRRQLQTDTTTNNNNNGTVANVGDSTIDYGLLALKISDICTTEAQNYLLNFEPEEYACMGVAGGLQIDFNFIPFE